MKKAQHPAVIEPTTSRVLLCRCALYHCAAAAVAQTTEAVARQSLNVIVFRSMIPLIRTKLIKYPVI